jgi:hypothetical protein
MTDQAVNLTAAISAAIANPAWKSTSDGTTFCNEFCQEILHTANCHELDGLVARDMGNKIVTDIMAAGDGLCKWQEVTAQKAVDAAKIGAFVLGWSPILEEQHGHVVIVAPEDMEDSGTFGCPVPMVASIAPYPFLNRIMKVSEAYRVANKPRFFQWLG